MTVYGFLFLLNDYLTDRREIIRNQTNNKLCSIRFAWKMSES